MLSDGLETNNFLTDNFDIEEFRRIILSYSKLTSMKNFLKPDTEFD